MIFKNPLFTDIPQLRNLWLEAFGDSDEFWQFFLKNAYHYERCRVAEENGKIVSALYFFDCLCEDKKIAYIYGVATLKSEQGKGFCKGLFADTHNYLKEKGYYGAVLVPSKDGLFPFYEKLGYKTPLFVDALTLKKEDCPKTELRRIDKTEYAALRRKLLPDSAVIQENESLDFLSSLEELFAGNEVLLAAHIKDNVLYAAEFLGDRRLLPSILATLGAEKGSFRTVGAGKPFALYKPFYENSPKPSYFGLAFD